MTPRELRAIFVRERRRFPEPARHAGLALNGSHYDRRKRGFRDLAWCDYRTRTVHLLTRALKLPRANVLGLLRHELGHLADRTPWKDGAEQRADNIAERATGERVRYDRRNVQTVSKRGRYPRPRTLHQ